MKTKYPLNIEHLQDWSAHEKISSIWIDKEKELTVNIDHNLVLLSYECKVVSQNKRTNKQAKEN